MIKFITIIIATLTLTACSFTDSRCHLLSVAYNEQDELGREWYEHAAQELRSCGYKISNEPQTRGVDANGYRYKEAP